MAETANRVECRWCKSWVTIETYKAKHGRYVPWCMGQRTIAWCKTYGYGTCGPDHVVLDRAGVLKYKPLYDYTWYVNPEWTAWTSLDVGKRASSRPAHYLKDSIADYTALAPIWACKLARRLLEDQVLASKLGGKKVAATELTGMLDRRYNPDSARTRLRYRYILPIDYRAAIIKACAANAMTRELVEDDPLTALTIMRDVG